MVLHGWNGVIGKWRGRRGRDGAFHNNARLLTCERRSRLPRSRSDCRLGFYRPGYPESARYKPRILSFRSVDAGDAMELFVSNHVLHMLVEHEGVKTEYEFANYVFQMRRCVDRCCAGETALRTAPLTFPPLGSTRERPRPGPGVPRGGVRWGGAAGTLSRSRTRPLASAGAAATSACTSTDSWRRPCGLSTRPFRHRPTRAA